MRRHVPAERNRSVTHRQVRTGAAVLLVLGIGLAASSPTFAQKNLKLEDEIFKSLHWRSIGPAVMGGRISDIAVDPKNSAVYYLGLATGGVMKTTNNGMTWNAVFEHETCASIGALAVAPSDSKIVWCGTGEPNGRNSSAWGDGIYKSVDGGQSWKNMGLKESQSIARILIDPANPDVVYVAVVGHLWGPNKERGVYKTTDGGKTWTPALVLSETTGAIDLAFGAPGSGNLYAATYERQRFPWGYSGLSKNSGIYKSSDFGKTWKRLTVGLPEGKLGRIGLAVSAGRPNIVYAVIESQQGGSGGLEDTTSRHGGVFRSEDAGATWKRMSGTAPRGFYFGQIRVDPTDSERVYVLGFNVSVSKDGGKTFEDGSSGVHSDMHTLWIDPVNPDRLLLGGDGGLYTTYDKSKTWAHINNFAAGEFYEVAVDDRQPFHCYGGLQDNGSWSGPAATNDYGGPLNSDWDDVNGGDGFYVVPDPTDPNIVYAESQGGEINRIDRAFNRRKNMKPTAAEGSPDYRFNWNTPFFISHFDHDSIYVGGNVLVKWTQQGKEWNVISPDLSKKHGERITTAGSGAETYGTIVCLAESPKQKGLIWAGTDDGNVQITLDDGETWANVTNNLPEKVRDYYVARIAASGVSTSRAYVAIDGHRSDDMGAYLYVTEDFGRTWKSLTGDLPKSGPVKALREDPVNPNLLFVGTEYGAFASIDRGEHWYKLDKGLPTVSVNDLAIQGRDHALVAATHGRSLYVMDNIAPLQDLTPKLLNVEVHLFSVPPAFEFNPNFRSGESTDFQGENRQVGAEIVFWMKSLADDNPSVVIKNAADKTVARLSGERFAGLQKLRWDLRTAAEGSGGRRRFAFGRSVFVPPGTYTATLTVGKEKQTQKFVVSGPPELSQEPSDGDTRREDAGK